MSRPSTAVTVARVNGIELAWDRPSSEWPRKDGALIFDRKPLNFAGLLAELGEPGRARLDYLLAYR